MLFQLLINHIFCREFIYELTIIFVISVIFRLLHQLKQRYSRYQIFKQCEIPGPKPNLLCGNYLEYELLGNKLEKDFEWKKKYGNFVGFFFGDEPCIQTTDLDVLKQAFLVDKETFCERSKTIVDIPLTRGLLYARYPRWRAMRSMLSPPFAKFHRRGGTSSQFIEDTMRELINYIDKKHEKCMARKEPCILDIRSLMKATSLNLINTMAIGLPGLEIKENEPTVALLDEFLEKGNRGVVVLAVFAPVFKKLFSYFMRNIEIVGIFRRIHKCLDEMIADGLVKIRKTYPLFESKERSSLEMKNSRSTTSVNNYGLHQVNSQASLSRFDGDEQQKESPSDLEPREELAIDTMVRSLHEGKLSRLELYGTAEIILLAGYDTSATTLAYIFWVIADDQVLQEKLRETLMTHGIESEYLRQVIFETMRLYPVAPYIATRLATKTTKLKQWIIPAGTKIIYNSWLVHRDSDVWDNPLEFKPERFADMSNHHPCAFAPFGLGDKRCLAYQLAQLEMKMIICDILLNYRVKLQRPKKLELEPIGFVTTQPKEEVFIELERINPTAAS